MNYIIDTIKFKPKLSCLFSGLLSGLIFAPIFMFPCVFALGILAYHTWTAETPKKAFAYGFWFGIGHFLVGLYWVTFAIFVYIDDFWWAIPFALLGLPFLLSFFIAGACTITNLFKNSKLFYLYFAIIWTIFEWLRSWLFTGLPWNLLGYCLSFSTELIQTSSIVGVLGISLIVCYISISPSYLLSKNFKLFNIHLFVSILILGAMFIFGTYRLNNHPTEFTDVSVRLVQPSIPQKQKWDINQFIGSIHKHIELSQADSSITPKIIIWSESALPTLINDPRLLEIISGFLKPEQILITGAIGTTLKDGSQKQHVGMYGLDHLGKIIFEYEKIHLVPFGEYIPLKKLLPIQKLSKSIMDLDYSPGEINRTFLLGNLKAIPLICYEIIFSEEVRSRNHLADLIINITNDAWYGNSSGPYQHFRIAQMRAVENGIPVLRVANNGISAIIDPLGRIIMQTKLDEETYIDGYIPNKLTKSTIFASSPQLIFLFLLVLIIYTNELMKLKWIKI